MLGGEGIEGVGASTRRLLLVVSLSPHNEDLNLQRRRGCFGVTVLGVAAGVGDPAKNWPSEEAIWISPDRAKPQHI